LEGRLHLEWISSAEAQKFARVVTEFTEAIRAMGPSPITLYKQRMEKPGAEEKFRAFPDFSSVHVACWTAARKEREAAESGA